MAKDDAERELQAADDELPEVVIEDEPAAEAKDGKDKDGKPARNVTTEDDLAGLKAQLAAAETARRNAEQQATQANQRATEATSNVQQVTHDKFYAQEVAIANAIAAASNEAEAITAEIARLTQEGKAEDVAAAYRKLSRAETRIMQAEQQKTYVDSAKAEFAARLEAEKQRAEQAARQPQQPQVSPRAKLWIDAHPRFVSDQGYYNAAIGAHNIAVMKNIPVDSDEYFEFIEEQLGERQAVEPEERTQQRRSSSSAAPPSRSVPASGGGKVQRITLTAREREAADAYMSHITDPAERYRRYARNKQSMETNNPLVQS